MRIESIALAVTFLACTLLAAASSPTVTQVGQLFGTDVQETDFFGSATAMSQDGKTVAVGAPLGNGTAGEIYVYTRPSSGWGTMNQTARLHSTGQCILGQTLAMSADGGTIASSAGGCSGGG